MSREPDEGCGDAERADAAGDDTAAPGETGSQDDAFDRIVAGWRAEGSVPDWPDDPPPADDGATGNATDGSVTGTTDGATGGATPSGPTAPAPPPAPAPWQPGPDSAGPPAVHRPGPAGDPTDDDHYHPPEPPPLPRPGPPVVVGAALIVIGVLLIAVPETLGMSGAYGLPLGLLGIAAGLTWLVMRMWPSPGADEPPDDDDGAVL